MDNDNRQYYYNIFLSVSLALIITLIFKMLIGFPTLTIDQNNIKDN